MIRPAALIGCILTCMLAAAGAQGKLCGDDVGGRDVPCACGDTVVSTVVLTDDPVLSAVCSGDGLVVRAPAATAGVTIDLAGKALRGRGHGTGIWVIHGGPGGARLISTGGRGRIDGFTDGIVAHGADTVARVVGILVTGSTRDGVRIDAPGYVIDDTQVDGAQRDGFSVGGRNFQVTNTLAHDSGRHGFFVRGADGSIGTPHAGNRARDSGNIGFNVTGMGHQLTACVASGARNAGVRLNGMQYWLTGCVAEDNGGDGIVGMGMDLVLTGNRALNNARNGLVVRGVRVTDRGGNSAAGNAGQGQQRPAVQCAINGVACRP